MARVHRQNAMSPEEKARIAAIRDRFQSEKPSMGDLLASKEVSHFGPHGEYLDMQAVFAALKEERQRLGLSLNAMEKKTGIKKAALSRLENGKQTNPTIETIYRYAAGIGKRILWSWTDSTSNQRHP